MAISVVQSVSSSANSATSISQTITSTWAGNLLLIAYSVSNSSVGTTISVTGGTTQTFTQFITTLNSGNTGQTDAWYVKNCASGTTQIKVARNSGSGQMSIVVTEVSGIDTTAPLDKQISSTASGTTGTTATTTQASEFWWAVFMSASSGAGGLPSVSAISSPWTSDQATNSTLGAGNTDVSLGTAYQIVSTTGTANATATQNNAAGNGTAGFAATFKAASAAAVVTGSTLLMMGVG